MPDYVYQVRIYADINYVGRGQRPAGMQQNNSNVTGFGPAQGPGDAPAGQSMRFQQSEVVPNAITVAPTAANITTAIQTAATDMQTQLTAAVMATIGNWASGSE
jgi:hypothetical protein